MPGYYKASPLRAATPERLQQGFDSAWSGLRSPSPEVPISARLKKHLGQHIIAEPSWLAAIADAAGVAEGESILEIGAGPGLFTRTLASRVGPQGRVVAIEIDRDWTDRLGRSVGEVANVEVRWEDALQTDLDAALAAAPRWRCVANIPYYITSPLVQKLVEARRHFTELVLLMQKEVAVRLHAHRGRDVGMLSYYVQYHMETAVGLDVPPSAFTPPPRVDSALLLLRPRTAPPVDVPFAAMQPIIHAGFAARRKMLRGTLRSLAGEGVEAWLERAGVSPQARPEDLDLHDYARLAGTRP